MTIMITMISIIVMFSFHINNRSNDVHIMSNREISGPLLRIPRTKLTPRFLGCLPALWRAGIGKFGGRAPPLVFICVLFRIHSFKWKMRRTERSYFLPRELGAGNLEQEPPPGIADDPFHCHPRTNSKPEGFSLRSPILTCLSKTKLSSNTFRSFPI